MVAAEKMGMGHKHPGYIWSQVKNTEIVENAEISDED